MKIGKFYGLGIGPGDPELLTVKAQKILSSVPIIAVPKGCGQRSYAHSVIRHLINEKEQEILELSFAMDNDRKRQILSWKEAIDRIFNKLNEGRDVAFLTEGDPYFYSTFIPLEATMRKMHPEVEIDVIPGISSVHAAAIAAKIPLAVADDRIAILPALYEMDGLKETIENFDIIVLMKVNSVLDHVIDILVEMNLAGNAFVVEKCGTAEEMVFPRIIELRGKKLHYFSTLIIKK